MSYDIRRDNKGRKLLNGESQRKDGMYEYKSTWTMQVRENRYIVGN